MESDLIGRLKAARRIAILTGAGTSAESGVPTFRDAQSGIWARFRPEELATPEAFRRNPQRVWEWYQWRREQLGEISPNPAHESLVRMEALFDELTLITQNVDGLHQAAGSRKVIELHGNIRRTICHRTRRVIEDDYLSAAEGSPPASPHDPDGLARPDVVWFGEALPADALNRAVDAAESCHVFFSIGTSAVVEPAASLARTAKLAGAVVVEINPEETPLSRSADYVLRGPAGEILPQLVSAISS